MARLPLARAKGARDELAIKLAVAATLPGVDAATTIHAQRAASLEHLETLRQARRTKRGEDGPEGLAWSLVVDSMIFSAEAEVRWLDHAAERLTGHPQHAMALELTAERPKRGRPAKSGAAITETAPAA